MYKNLLVVSRGGGHRLNRNLETGVAFRRRAGQWIDRRQASPD